jgi:hypothetical protein
VLYLKQVKITIGVSEMSYQFFNRARFNKELIGASERTSYRELAELTNGKMSYSKIHRIATKDAEMSIKQAEILMDVMGYNWEDFIVIHMF